jgi:hypothetical protein
MHRGRASEGRRRLMGGGGRGQMLLYLLIKVLLKDVAPHFVLRERGVVLGILPRRQLVPADWQASPASRICEGSALIANGLADAELRKLDHGPNSTLPKASDEQGELRRGATAGSSARSKSSAFQAVALKVHILGTAL